MKCTEFFMATAAKPDDIPTNTLNIIINCRLLTCRNRQTKNFLKRDFLSI